MPVPMPYDREAAVAYAHQWAYGRNPVYLDFSPMGGDCTNFASQCIFAGSGVMNYKPLYGWFYRTGNHRTPSWTGVDQLYNFLTSNKGPGPFGAESTIRQIMPGDVVQLAIGSDVPYHHSPVIVRIDGEPTLGSIYIAAHSFDCDTRPLSSYAIWKIRYIHIEGVRK
ncbi:MAG: amidase domain-containing protein [Clostridiaceae bacterium]|nr:amidase domain-containing protein [Clostridiaceae bacterium]